MRSRRLKAFSVAFIVSLWTGTNDLKMHSCGRGLTQLKFGELTAFIALFQLVFQAQFFCRKKKTLGILFAISGYRLVVITGGTHLTSISIHYYSHYCYETLFVITLTKN